MPLKENFSLRIKNFATYFGFLLLLNLREFRCYEFYICYSIKILAIKKAVLSYNYFSKVLKYFLQSSTLFPFVVCMIGCVILAGSVADKARKGRTRGARQN